MRVFFSSSFEKYSSKIARDALVAAFKLFKASPENEYTNPLIGKDSAFVEPKINGKRYVLRHCHLAPLNDPEAKSKWQRDHRRGSRKTSDRILIYVQQDDDFYLIDIVDDPGAHELMKMHDVNGKSFMLKCAQEADDFLNSQVNLLTA